MKANLYINYYIDKNPKRHRELVSCLLENIKNTRLDMIYIVIDPSHIDNLNKVVANNNTNGIKGMDKITIIEESSRPSYNYYFELTRRNNEDINIIANTDIIIPASTIKMLNAWNFGRRCLALSRWDYITNRLDNTMARHHSSRDSQDTWIAKGGFPNIPSANFPLGKKGCDNRIAFILSKHYEVLNPSINLRTYHYHVSEVRNYKPHGTNEDLVPPPYKFITPTTLPR